MTDGMTCADIEAFICKSGHVVELTDMASRVMGFFRIPGNQVEVYGSGFNDHGRQLAARVYFRVVSPPFVQDARRPIPAGRIKHKI